MVNGKKIREIRKANGITSTELSEAVYVSQAMIIYIEKGVKQPSADVLSRIAKVFGCAMDELMEPPEPDAEVAYIASKQDSDQPGEPKAG